MRKFRLLLILSIVTLCFSCRKDPGPADSSSQVELGQTTVDTVSGTWIILTTKIIKVGPTPVTDHGYCWNFTGNPDVSGFHLSLGPVDRAGDFLCKITGLSVQKKYFIRCYATDQSSTVYGKQVVVTTDTGTPPSVTTADVTGITSNSAVCGGSVGKPGDGAVTARGVCWNRAGNPTLENCIAKTSEGKDTGVFRSNLTGLKNDSTYFVAAYATNQFGTSYGAVTSFTTNKFWQCGESISYAGEDYPTVLIGMQCWMAKNLNVGTMLVDYWFPQADNGIIEKYCYHNDSSMCSKYGGLYMWREMLSFNKSGSRGICPEGWHPPSDDEWKILEDALGGFAFAGQELKSDTGWLNGGNGTNSSGFNALPAGFESNGYIDQSVEAHFWTSTEYNNYNTTMKAFYRGLAWNRDWVERFYHWVDNSACSVRCVKDSH